MAPAGTLPGVTGAHHQKLPEGPGVPVRLILDTDFFSDVDDAGALALLNALQGRGEARILAVMVNTPGRWGAPAVDAVNTYYHHGGIPVGTLKPNDDSDHSYAKYLAQHFPNSLKDGVRAPDAVALYRQVLARQPDRSVVIASVGYLTNLSNLLDSPPDRHSRRSGRELVARKVKELVVMGGAYPSGREWNFSQDPAAARNVVDRWPTRQVFSGFEVGADVYTGARLATTPEGNPVRKAYELYPGTTPEGGRSSWDLTAAYYAVRGGGGLFGLAGGTGSNRVHPDGSNEWVRHPDKDQHYLVKAAPAEAIARALEDLLVEPPRKGPGP